MSGELRRYEITTPSGMKTVMLLNDKDAESYGDAATPVDGGPAAAAPAEEQAKTKAKAPANKSAAADSNK